ncbi:DUF4233 domain-containing protein [Pseudonocardia sp. GCM10023141]|uniref:DUF4233 domain-containing protein n=1 Tax=Pseudonocardia sp. GCM10023141 TaxID=3252653 RepID=UPI0036189A8F
MTAPEEPPRPAPPDPMKGIRGVFAATLVLEAIVVLLALLVLSKFGDGATPLGVTVIVVIALLMIVACGMQRRPWGLGLALGLQVVTIVCGFLFVPALGWMGGVFLLVWIGLLLMRRDVAQKMARGELPSQRS